MTLLVLKPYLPLFQANLDMCHFSCQQEGKVDARIPSHKNYRPNSDAGRLESLNNHLI